MTVFIQQDSSAVVKSLDNVVKNLQKELGTVVMKTARKGKSFIAKSVTQELAVTQKVVKAHVEVKKEGPTTASVSLDKSPRIPLKEFRARQTKTGVSYKTSKSKGGKRIEGGFIVSRYGGNVFKRRSGVKRQVGSSKKGPSPWGVFVKKKRRRTVKKQLSDELDKQLKERLRYRRLKQSGAI